MKEGTWPELQMPRINRGDSPKARA